MNTRLQELLARTWQVSADQITAQTAQGDIPAWDSQGHLDLIMNLEATFGVELELAEAVEMRSVAAIEAALRRRRVLD